MNVGARIRVVARMPYKNFKEYIIFFRLKIADFWLGPTNSISNIPI